MDRQFYQCVKRMHTEIAMKPVLEIKPIRLPVRSIHRLDSAKGQQITCLDGVVWVTQANDNRDIILSKGQSFVVDRKGLAVVFALKEAAIAIGPAGHIAAAAFDPAVVQGIAA
jgi:Protein of unknown function (DUF2917)